MEVIMEPSIGGLKDDQISETQGNGVPGASD